MVLYLNNDINQRWAKGDDEILQGFVNSDYAKDSTRDVSIRMALYIAGELKSTFRNDEFRELSDRYAVKRHTYSTVSSRYKKL